jgi:hypothetical protein
MHEPKWRLILIWGCVVYFLAIPIFVITYAMLDLSPIDKVRSDFIQHFHYAITGILAALAGLNTLERKNNGKPVDSKSRAI